MDELHELRDLVLDHLGAGRLLHASTSRGTSAGRSRSRSAGRSSPLIILTVAVSMSELASAFPTAGGPYWWAHRLGGPGWSWFTGWFNVLGLDRDRRLSRLHPGVLPHPAVRSGSLDLGFINFADHHVVRRSSPCLWSSSPCTPINIFSHRLLALFNSISVFWHVVGIVIIIGILVFVPDHHQSAKFVFTAEDQQLRLRRRSHRRRHLLVPRPTGRLPADDLHDHRL